jgi:hypothetical protein
MATKAASSGQHGLESELDHPLSRMMTLGQQRLEGDAWMAARL